LKRALFALIALTPSTIHAQAAPPISKQGRATPAGSSDSLTLSGTGRFYSQNGATIHRLSDRLFTGLATVNDGAFPNVTKDWLSTLETRWGHSAGYPVFSMLATLTNNDRASGYAILGGAQTLQLAPSGAAIGVQGHGIANQPSSGSSAWGFYGEAHRTVSRAGSAYGIEVDPVAHVFSISPTPNQQGDTIAAQLACGGGYKGFRQFDCSSAVQIAPNGASFVTGINVMKGAIAGRNPSIQLPTGNGLVFHDSAGHVGGAIRASFTGNTANLDFDNKGLEITATSGTPIASFLVTGVVTVGTALKLPKSKVAALPACAAANEGELAAVNDARSETFNAKIEGGGSNHVLAYCNGAKWTVH